jgi:hypothetical protein
VATHACTGPFIGVFQERQSSNHGEQLLRPTLRTLQSKQEDKPLLCLLTYNPHNPPIRSILEQNKNILDCLVSSGEFYSITKGHKYIRGVLTLVNLEEILLQSDIIMKSSWVVAEIGQI